MTSLNRMHWKAWLSNTGTLSGLSDKVFAHVGAQDSIYSLFASLELGTVQSKHQEPFLSLK